jgi:hypothetical protein
LSLVGFYSASLTRTDVQFVNNLQNEKEALSIAEAGVTEAIYRLSLGGTGTATTAATGAVTVNGVLFDPAIVPETGADWNARVVYVNAGGNSFTGTAPSRTLTTPSLQPTALRLPYTTTSVSSTSLAIAWEKNGAAIRTDSSGRKIIKITSTGTSGSAARKVTVWAVAKADEDTGDGGNEFIALGTNCTPGVSTGGNQSFIHTNGGVHVNAGPNPSACPGALGGNGNVQADVIDVVGGENTTTTPSEPPGLNTGVKPVEDPLKNLLPPCYSGGPSPCIGTNPSVICANTCTASSVATGGHISPGVYGGLTINGDIVMNPGVYIISSGNFAYSNGNLDLSGTGVTIYLNAGSISGGNGGASVNLSAPTSGNFQGILVYQARGNSTQLSIQAGNHPTNYNGTIYAPNAPVDLRGGGNLGVAGNFIVSSLSMNGNTSLDMTTSGTTPPGMVPAGIRYTPIAWQDF